MDQPVLTQYAVPVGEPPVEPLAEPPTMAPPAAAPSRGRAAAWGVQLAAGILMLILAIALIYYGVRHSGTQGRHPPKAPFVGAEMIGNAWAGELAQPGY